MLFSIESMSFGSFKSRLCKAIQFHRWKWARRRRTTQRSNIIVASCRRILCSHLQNRIIFYSSLCVCLCRRQTNAASAKPSRVLVFDTSTSHFSYSRLHSSLGSLEWFQHSPFKSVDHFIHFSNILFCVASQFKPEIEMFWWWRSAVCCVCVVGCEWMLSLRWEMMRV